MPTGFKGKNLHYTDRSGTTRLLKDGWFFTPARRPKAKIAVLYAFVGWGHMFQAFAMGHELAKHGFEVYVSDCLELATPGEQRHFRKKQRFLHALSHPEEAWREIYRDIRKNPFHIWKDLLSIIPYELADGQMRVLNLGASGRRGRYDWLMWWLAQFIKRSPWLEKKILKASVRFEGRLTDKPLSPSLLHFLKSKNISYIVGTHSVVGRALLGTEYEEKIFFPIPDPGYAVHPAVLQPMAVLSDRIRFGVPDKRLGQMLTKMFDISPRQIHVIGTIATSLNPRLIKAKWKNKKTRRILLSTSGNGAHLDLLERGLRDFAPELKKKKTPYQLFVFLGDLPDHKVKPLLDEVQKSGLKNNPRLQIIRTKRAHQMAYWKWYLKNFAHVEIAKPGEHPLDCPQLGTFFLGLPGVSPNEPENMRYAARIWKSGIPSVWPQKSYEYWKTYGYRGRPWDNLVDYLNHLFTAGLPLNNFSSAPSTASSFICSSLLAFTHQV